MARVVVGLSGGVDSSVSAHLLKEQGHEVIGIYMLNWHDDTVTLKNDCPWVEDSNDALIIADRLGIPFHVLDLSKEYKERIVDYMFAEYERGRTPNPDILCNREIKYDLFLDAAKKLGAEFIATGHYCRKDTLMIDGQEKYRLLAGKDGNKDQSYFLCQLTQEQLKYALFPIGELTKPEVREIAREQGFENADKKDSQGLCFVGKVRLPEFLQQQLEPREGVVVEIDRDFDNYVINGPQQEGLGQLKALTAPFEYEIADGTVIGNHPGAHYFTIGQRKGLNIGGHVDPLFVIGTDTRDNVIYTGMGEDHPGLLRKGLYVRNSDIHWVRDDLELGVGESREYLARIRYRQPLQKSTLYREEDGLYVIFDELQKGITPGQFVAWYDEDELIGSGVID